MDLKRRLKQHQKKKTWYKVKRKIYGLWRKIMENGDWKIWRNYELLQLCGELVR